MFTSVLPADSAGKRGNQNPEMTGAHDRTISRRWYRANAAAFHNWPVLFALLSFEVLYTLLELRRASAWHLRGTCRLTVHVLHR